jgi:hypothetical protein
MASIKYKRLREIIKEELESYLEEELLSDENAYHDDKGHFTSKEKAKTYSFTKGSGVRDDLIKRGKVKGDKVIAKYGMNSKNPKTSCGRLDFHTGDEKPITKSCKDYNKPYGSMKEQDEESSPDNDAYIKALIQSEIRKELSRMQAKNRDKTCKPNLVDFLKFQRALTDATSERKDG